MLGQLCRVDLAVPPAAAGPGHEVAAFTPVLLEPADPGGADLEHAGDDERGLTRVARRDHTATQVHRVSLHAAEATESRLVALDMT